MNPSEYFDYHLNSIVELLYPSDDILHQAARYALIGSGKRVRPQMVLLTAQSCGGSFGNAVPAAFAVECVHAYSLVHDDLPIMDNDDWRRGKPSTHRVFGEAQALLAGDALLSDSFRVLSDESLWMCSLSCSQRCMSVEMLSKAIGSSGMVLGQSLDVLCEKVARIDEQLLLRIHKNKTGKLIAAACAMGAISAGRDCVEVQKWFDFGEKVGLSFQIVDDLLDNSHALGKTPGKDLALGKANFLGYHGENKAKQLAQDFLNEAMAEVDINDSFSAFVLSLIERVN